MQYMFPVEPFQEIVGKAYQQCKTEGLDFDAYSEHQLEGIMNPQEQVAFRVSQAFQVGIDAAEKRLRRLMNGQTKEIELGFADAIICACAHPDVWYSDERLAPLYEAISG